MFFLPQDGVAKMGERLSRWASVRPPLLLPPRTRTRPARASPHTPWHWHSLLLVPALLLVLLAGQAMPVTSEPQRGLGRARSLSNGASRSRIIPGAGGSGGSYPAITVPTCLKSWLAERSKFSAFFGTYLWGLQSPIQSKVSCKRKSMNSTAELRTHYLKHDWHSSSPHL